MPECSRLLALLDLDFVLDFQLAFAVVVAIETKLRWELQPVSQSQLQLVQVQVKEPS